MTPMFAAAGFLGLQTADWLVLLVYFIVILAIGIWSFTKVKTMADFFMGGRRFGKVFMMFFAFGSGTSSEQAVSVVAGTWRVGLAGIWWQFLWLWATPFYWIVAPVMRRMRALTTADFFEARYGPSTATLYSLFGIIMSIVFIASGLYGSGKMVNALTGGELDDVAERMNIHVPVLKLGTTPFIDRLELDMQEDLDQGVLSDALTAKFKKSKGRLTNDVTVKVVTAGSEWEVIDNTREWTYPIKKVTVKERIDGGDEVKEVDVLRVYGAGWRLLDGYELAILAMTIMFVTYGMAGGLGAAIITDFIQGILTIAFSFLLLPFVFNMIGGFGELHKFGDLKDGMLDLVASAEVAASLGKEPITYFYVFMLSFTALAGIVVQPHIMGVCGAGKTEFEGRFGFTVGNFIKRFCTMAWTFTGLACIVWYLNPDLSPLADGLRESLTPGSPTYDVIVDNGFADELFGRAAFEILPHIAPGLVGLLLASLLAAIMSSSDAQMVVSSGLFTENIYKRFFVRNKSERHYLWTGRLSGLIIVLLALALQATFTDVIDALKVVLKTPALLGISLWFGIVWRGWTPLAVWASFIAAAVAWWGVGWFALDIANVDSLRFMMNADLTKVTDKWLMASFMTVGIVTGILVSFVTPRTNKDKLDHFFRLLHTPVKPDEVLEGPCTLPSDPLPQGEKMFNFEDIEIAKPTLVGLGGFAVAWILVGGIIWLTYWLAQNL